MARNHPEQAFQFQVADYLRRALPPADAWFTAIDHRNSSPVMGAIRKGMGVQPGLPDLLILWGAEPIWLELKSPKGRLSDAQRRCFERLSALGCLVYEVRTLDEIEEILISLGMPLRARVRA